AGDGKGWACGVYCYDALVAVRTIDNAVSGAGGAGDGGGFDDCVAVAVLAEDAISLVEKKESVLVAVDYEVHQLCDVREGTPDVRR
ncbi:MAG: hypothetical protein Q9192_006852, partial [Flavoplaca navasiana]